MLLMPCPRCGQIGSLQTYTAWCRRPYFYYRVRHYVRGFGKIQHHISQDHALALIAAYANTLQEEAKLMKQTPQPAQNQSQNLYERVAEGASRTPPMKLCARASEPFEGNLREM